MKYFKTIIGTVLGTLLTVVILTACGTETPRGANSNIGNQNNMPKEMTEDFDFMVRFGYGQVTKNEIDTYQDKVTKDLVSNGTVTADITLTIEEMRSIYDKMREINVLETKVLVPADENCSAPIMKTVGKLL